MPLALTRGEDLLSFAAAHRERLLGFCLTLTGQDREQACELLHHTLDLAVEAIGRGVVIENPHGYLVVCLRNRWRRQHNRGRGVLVDLPDSDTHGLSEEQPDLVLQGLAYPDDSAEGLLLEIDQFVVAKFGIYEAGCWQLYTYPQRDGSRFTYEEIAEMMEMPYSNVRRRVAEIKAAIAKQFRERYRELLG